MNWKLASMLAAVTLTFGCHKGAYEARTEPQAAYENTETVVLLGGDIRRSIAVEGQQAKLAEDGRLQVFANIRNRWTKRLTVQVQTVFKDENGFSTGDETAWETMIITERSQTSYQTTSQNTNARKYTIRIRSLR